MEFEDEHEEEEEEEEEDDEGEEITIPPPPPQPQPIPPSYDSSLRVSNSERLRSSVTRYRECLKNHAVNIGGHALDGCGEFMPAGMEGTLDALKCAACTCHRNFHRKETTTTTTGAFYHRTPAVYLHAPPRQVVAARPSTSSGEIDDGGGGRERRESGSGGMMMMMKKRHRTKFTQEQKDKMLGFAERLGWRIQKHDEAAVEQFCAEIQIKRHVLKVWMHNNKNTLGKKP